MNSEDVLTFLKNLDLKEAFVGAVTSISIGEFFLGVFLILMFAGINAAGYVNVKLFKRKRKRIYYLDKIDSQANYSRVF